MRHKYTQKITISFGMKNLVWKPPGTTTNLAFGTAAGYEIKPDGVTTTLFLPAAGYRGSGNGQLSYPGITGYYWSVTIYGPEFWIRNIQKRLHS
jgi:hypothetical protein